MWIEDLEQAIVLLKNKVKCDYMTFEKIYPLPFEHGGIGFKASNNKTYFVIVGENKITEINVENWKNPIDKVL